MKIHQFGVGLFYASTHGRTDMTQPIIAFHNFAKGPQTDTLYTYHFCLHWYTAVVVHKHRNFINYALRHKTKGVLWQASPPPPTPTPSLLFKRNWCFIPIKLFLLNTDKTHKLRFAKTFSKFWVSYYFLDTQCLPLYTFKTEVWNLENSKANGIISTYSEYLQPRRMNWNCKLN